MVRQRIADSPEPIRLGGVGAVVSHALESLVPFEVRCVVLGHLQRGGGPTRSIECSRPGSGSRR